MATSSDNLSDEDYHYVLRNNEKKIANLINPTCLVPVLLTKGLLIENELKLLQGIAPDKRGAQLVQILLDKKGGNVLNLFIQALREEEEHIGHRNLAFKLLAELPKPSFHCRAATLPAKPVKRQTAPKRAVSISVSALGHTSNHVVNQQSGENDSSQQCLDNVHQLKQMSKKLQRTLSTQQNTMQTVHHLAKVIADMQEKMSTMQQHLSILLENNQKNSNIYTTIDQTTNYKVKCSPYGGGTSNDYVDGPLSTDADSFTKKVDSGVHQVLQMNREEAVMCIQLGCLLPELRKRKLVTEFEVHQLSDKIKAPKEKNRHLMSIIESKGEKGFDLFIQALEAEKQHVNHSHLAKMLREAQAALTGQLITPPRLPPKDPVTGYTPLFNISYNSDDRRYTQATKQPRINQAEFVEEIKLANGKSGEIWLVVNKQEGSKVAIKKSISVEMFMQEKSALANICHPNIIRLIDSSITQSPVLTFEYAENGNLLNRLKSSASSFNTSKLLRLSADVACGMSELEKRAIVHCDVRAKSILIDGHFVCKVASFGKAICLKPGKSSYTPLSNITINIAVKWAAPEILSKRKFSIKSDIWAFGILLSEVFSQGNTPYPSMDNAKVKSAVKEGIKMFQPNGCPNEVYELMKLCFEFDANSRPSFDAVHQLLQELYCKNPMSEASSSGSECEDL